MMAMRKGHWELPQLEEQHSEAPSVSSDRDIITLKSSLYFVPVEFIKSESTLQKKKRGILTCMTSSVLKHPSFEYLYGPLLFFTSGCYYPQKKCIGCAETVEGSSSIAVKKCTIKKGSAIKISGHVGLYL